MPGRSSSFGGIPTGRLPTATSRSAVKSRMLEHGVPSNNAEARRSMTRPSFDWRGRTVSSGAVSATHEPRTSGSELSNIETSKRSSNEQCSGLCGQTCRSRCQSTRAQVRAAIVRAQMLVWRPTCRSHHVSSQHSMQPIDCALTAWFIGRARMTEDERIAVAELEVEKAKERLRMRTGSADTTVPIVVGNPSPPPSQSRREQP